MESKQPEQSEPLSMDQIRDLVLNNNKTDKYTLISEVVGQDSHTRSVVLKAIEGSIND